MHIIIVWNAQTSLNLGMSFLMQFLHNTHIKLDSILNGDDRLATDQNIVLFDAVHTYIKRTK